MSKEISSYSSSCHAHHVYWSCNITLLLPPMSCHIHCDLDLVLLLWHILPMRIRSVTNLFEIFLCGSESAASRLLIGYICLVGEWSKTGLVSGWSSRRYSNNWRNPPSEEEVFKIRRARLVKHLQQCGTVPSCHGGCVEGANSLYYCILSLPFLCRQVFEVESNSISQEFPVQRFP